MATGYAETNLEDVMWVGRHMREDDKREVAASGGRSPQDALRFSVAASREAFTAFVDDEPVCIFGVSGGSLIGRSVSPWMLGSKKLEEYPITLARQSVDVVTTWQQEYKRMENFVDTRNWLSISWLNWLGFTICDAKPYGPYSMPFHKFYWEEG